MWIKWQTSYKILGIVLDVYQVFSKYHYLLILMIAVIIVLVLTSQFPYLDIFNPQITIPLDVLSSKKMNPSSRQLRNIPCTIMLLANNVGSYYWLCKWSCWPATLKLKWFKISFPQKVALIILWGIFWFEAVNQCLTIRQPDKVSLAPCGIWTLYYTPRYQSRMGNGPSQPSEMPTTSLKVWGH